ncbi:phage/plasmid primase, P4 family [Streptomyces mirabilis]|uniref:phage/plasmid primase, P4 family n=1 Tax=Streptomyces mirabilis TaxID=68239 RepID=UPI003321CAE9
MSEDVATARGYETLHGTNEDCARLLALGFGSQVWDRAECWPALLIPVHRATGEVITHQLKPAVPRVRIKGRHEQPVKYETPSGSRVHLDVPEFTRVGLPDLDEELWVTEGAKKTDSLVSQGLAAIGLSGVWCWRRSLGTLGDWEDVPLKGRASAVVCFDADARNKPEVRAAMRRFGAWLKSKGVRKVRYLIVPAEVNGTEVKGVDDYFAAGGTVETLLEAATDTPPDDVQDGRFTDTVLAEAAVAEVLDGRLRYADGMGWLHWTGSVWKGSSDRHVSQEIQAWARAKFGEALDAERLQPGRHRVDIDGWRGVLGASKQANIIKLASARPGVLTDAADLDAYPDLINCPNGVVDLRTGQLGKHDPDLLMTKVTGVEYRQGYTHPDWDKAMTALPEDEHGWYQVRMGQAITGHMTSDDVCVICQGGGDNGKSTMSDAMSAAAGTYFTKVSDRAMLGNASDNHPTEMMDFKGARYAVLEEMPDEHRLDVTRLKKLTGTRQIEARRMRENSITFDASHSLFVNTNPKPVVTETDWGTWRRLLLLCFPYTFKKRQEDVRPGTNDRLGDPTLRDRCQRDDGPKMAALAWMVDGARKWYELGRIMPQPPERVEADTRQWRMDSDAVLTFMAERLVFDLNSHVLVADLKEELNSYLIGHGQHRWSDRLINERFGGHDETTRHDVRRNLVRLAKAEVSRPKGRPLPEGVNAKVWAGIRFRTEADDEKAEREQAEREQAEQDQKRAEQDRVTAVTTPPVNPTRGPLIAVNPETGYSGYAPGQSIEAPSPNGHRSSPCTCDPDLFQAFGHDPGCVTGTEAAS